MKKWRTLFCVILASALTVSTAACSSSGNHATAANSSDASSDTAEASSSAEPTKIAISAWNPNVFMNLAQDLGYFDDAGVSVDLIDFAEFSDVPKAFNAGQLDGAFFSSFEVIAPASLDMDIRLVSVIDDSVGADALLTRGGETSLQELKGKRIGVGMDTVSHIFLMLLAQEEGCSLDDYELVDFSSPSNGATALVTGEIDALATFEPFITSCMNADDSISIVADTSAYPTMINDSIVFSGNILDTRFDDVVKVMECFYQAVDYWKENPDEANEMLGKYLDCSGEEFAETMTKLNMLSAEEAYAQMTAEGDDSWTASMSAMSSFLLERGRISQDIAPSDYVDTSVLAAITEN